MGAAWCGKTEAVEAGSVHGAEAKAPARGASGVRASEKIGEKQNKKNGGDCGQRDGPAASAQQTRGCEQKQAPPAAFRPTAQPVQRPNRAVRPAPGRAPARRPVPNAAPRASQQQQQQQRAGQCATSTTLAAASAAPAQRTRRIRFGDNEDVTYVSKDERTEVEAVWEDAEMEDFLSRCGRKAADELKQDARLTAHLHTVRHKLPTWFSADQVEEVCAMQALHLQRLEQAEARLRKARAEARKRVRAG
eukprot:TRINITY_DN18300_c0_g1_i1.p2 TRINITY_DN18300_c0_g1~~TRINITY_DN18300_c0_g1_i1.p2  ORF type:complete len:248 (+),score=84.77 TRINITY_DN18300_c0_g1_i1:81-824(+)